MFTVDGLLALHGWMHERLDLVLDHAEGLSPADFVRELPGFGQGSVRDQLAHVLGAEERWVCRLQGLPLPRWSPPEYPTVESLRSPKQRAMRATTAYLRRLSETELNARLDHTPPEWIGALESPAFIVHHVVTHAFHHKGQIVAMCRLLGHPAPDTDLQRA